MNLAKVIKRCFTAGMQTEAVFSFSASGLTVAFDVLYLNEYESAQVQQLQYMSSGPKIFCESEKITALGQGDSVKVKDITYYVNEIQPDTFGLTVLGLTKDAI